MLKNKKVLALVGLIIMLFIIFGIIVFRYFEKVKMNNGEPIAKLAVCGNDIIIRTNDTLKSIDFEKIDIDIEKLISDIRSKDGYRKDANCLNALFVVAITDYGRIPRYEQLDLMDDFKKVESEVSNEFMQKYTYEEIKNYIRRD